MDAIVARIIDANFNRAREALRVQEEYARFVLNDASICGALKVLRHDLTAALRSAGLTACIVSRNTPGDVGTAIETETEYHRVTTADVVIAAGKRTSEALRVVEEYGKTINAETARAVERIRYRAYEIEQRLNHVVSAHERFGRVRLYVLVTESLCRGPWQEVMSAAARGGADCFQLREGDSSDLELLDRARAFRAHCTQCGALCIINNRADVAVACNADGVHVGQQDLDVASVRRVVGPDRIVGVSTHTVQEAEKAAAARPDYIAVGPMFPTAIKPDYGVAGPPLLAAVRLITSLPLVAIGGIGPDNVSRIVEAGGRCVAVCSAVLRAGDPAEAARRLRTELAMGLGD